MPDIGRFFNIDPLSEKYSYQSHYNFSENKVVSHRELEGLEAIDANKVREVFDNGKKGKSYQLVIHVDQPGNGGDRTELLEAITDSKVIVQINATNSNFNDQIV